MKKGLTRLLLASAACGIVAGPAVAQDAFADYRPVTDEMLANPDAGEWIIYRQNYQGWGYSPLDQINADNVDGLTLVWSRTLQPESWNETTPLVHDGVMFIGMANDVVQAISATDGSLLWEYRRDLPDASELNYLGQNTRSVALYEDQVIFVSMDNFIVSLDATTGQVVWETDRGDNSEVSNSNGPIVINGVIVAGSTCQFAGFGCYVTGHDASNGEELWRHNFIPRPGEEGDETWGDAPFESRWMTGAWGGITYDPVTGLVYYGSTGAGPASEVQRGTVGGTMAGTNTRWAVDPMTGEVVWSHQVLPRDNWDQECTYEAIIVDTPVNPDADAIGMLAVGDVAGETRRVQTGVPCKTGIAWTLDAETGEFLWAKQTVEQNLVDNIDGEGLVTVNEDMILDELGVTYNMCPTFLGGRDWPTAAYSPIQNAFFVPLNNVCYDIMANEDEPTPDDVYNTTATVVVAPGHENIGRIDAVSVETGDTLWTWEMPGPLYSPVLATGGDILFTGGFDRYFRAIDAGTGEQIWSTRLPSQVDGHAVSFEIDGVQYVAVTTGGGLAGGFFSSITAGLDAPTGGNAVYVFALTGN